MKTIIFEMKNTLVKVVLSEIFRNDLFMKIYLLINYLGIYIAVLNTFLYLSQFVF